MKTITHDQAKRSIFEYIVSFYNYKRIHSTIKYHSPLEFEKLYYACYIAKEHLRNTTRSS
jgi:transposase InsO family protein